MISMTLTDSNFIREPLKAPFGFKGGYLTELWQIISMLESRNGYKGIGLGVQSILWSDPAVFDKCSEAAGNSLMYLMTEFALSRTKFIEFNDPMELFDQLIDDVYEYGKCITRISGLSRTFALNSLVAVDNAAWLLYAKENGLKTFDDMMPENLFTVLSHRQERLAGIPLISYGISAGDVKKIADDGCSILKIKIGSDPDGDGSMEKMLAWDMKRMSEIHDAVCNFEVPYTKKGRILYYLDANGRYDSKDRLMRFLEHADKAGAFERIILFEEPFPQEHFTDLRDIPVRFAADESIHSVEDANDRIDLGYGAIALKPAAKTLSLSLRTANAAHKRNIPCFCADLTVNPVLVDWNKNVAARLAPLPGMKIGVLESNGHQNYVNWEDMIKAHPCHDAKWLKINKGVYCIDNDFYEKSGGILQSSGYYSAFVK